MNLCRHLRWKGLYGRRFPDAAALELAFETADSPFSCLRTCQPWGPDDAVTAPERCQPARACFELSDRDPSRALS